MMKQLDPQELEYGTNKLENSVQNKMFSVVILCMVLKYDNKIFTIYCNFVVLESREDECYFNSSSTILLLPCKEF